MMEITVGFISFKYSQIYANNLPFLYINIEIASIFIQCFHFEA